MGIDLVKISRIERSMVNPRFLTRVFSVAEQEMLKRRGMSIQTAAANFAAKEAFSKALGTGVRGFLLSEVSVLRDDFGKPYFVLTGNALRLAEKTGMQFSVSLTHTEDTAAAFVIGYPASGKLD